MSPTGKLPQDQIHPVNMEPAPKDQAKTDVDSSSESSEEEEDAIKVLYGKLPEDLGFTLLSLGFSSSDFKVLRRLKMDLVTFMTLSEADLAELGVKDSHKIKELIKPNLEVLLKHKSESIFTQPKRNLTLSMDEICSIIKGMGDELSTVNTEVLNLNSALNENPPVNYRLSKSYQSREIFKLAGASLSFHSWGLADELQELEQVMKSNTLSPAQSRPQAVSKSQKKLAPWMKLTLVASTSCLLVFLAIKKLILPRVSK